MCRLVAAHECNALPSHHLSLVPYDLLFGRFRSPWLLVFFREIRHAQATASRGSVFELASIPPHIGSESRISVQASSGCSCSGALAPKIYGRLLKEDPLSVRYRRIHKESVDVRRGKTMKRRIAMTVLPGLLGLSLTCSEASASRYLSQRQAQSAARQHLKYDIGYYSTAAYCRPQGLKKRVAGYDYHRWVCGWVASSDGDFIDCKGAYLIVGSSRSRGSYYYRVLHKRGSCPYG